MLKKKGSNHKIRAFSDCILRIMVLIMDYFSMLRRDSCALLAP